MFKLRQTAGVKRLIEWQWQQGDWQNAGQGFDAVEGELRLAVWSCSRLVVVRRLVKDNLVAETSSEGQQQCLDRRIGSMEELRDEVAAWIARRDQIHAKVNWQFTTENARVKLKRLYQTFDA